MPPQVPGPGILRLSGENRIAKSEEEARRHPGEMRVDAHAGVEGADLDEREIRTDSWRVGRGTGRGWVWLPWTRLKQAAAWHDTEQ